VRLVRNPVNLQILVDHGSNNRWVELELMELNLLFWNVDSFYASLNAFDHDITNGISHLCEVVGHVLIPVKFTYQ
jgi:hypothetical protein